MSNSSRDNESKLSSPRFIEDTDLIGREADDFVVKTEKEVVKVPNCTYNNEAKVPPNIFYVHAQPVIRALM